MSGPPRISRALVLDDEASIARLCSRVIQALGTPTDTSGTVAMARALIGQNPYDLLVCDMRLPDGAGLDVEGLFRERNPRGGVIVITGSLAPGHPALEKAQGEIIVLTKPFELADFRGAVTSMLMAAAPPEDAG
jgi:two-component system response regulator PilR (NtrC family)